MAEIKQIGGFSENKRKGETYQTGYSVYDKEGVCPTLLANGGGYGILIIVEDKEMTEQDKTRQDKTRQGLSTYTELSSGGAW